MRLFSTHFSLVVECVGVHLRVFWRAVQGVLCTLWVRLGGIQREAQHCSHTSFIVPVHLDVQPLCSPFQGVERIYECATAPALLLTESLKGTSQMGPLLAIIAAADYTIFGDTTLSRSEIPVCPERIASKFRNTSEASAKVVSHSLRERHDWHPLSH